MKIISRYLKKIFHSESHQIFNSENISQDIQNEKQAFDEMQKAIAAKQKNNITESIEHVHNAIALQPENSLLHFELANLFKESKNYLEANEYYQTAIALQPDKSQYYLHYSLTLQEQYNHELAFTIAELGFKIDPESIALKLHLSDLYFQRRTENKAIVLLKQVIEKNPLHLDAYIKLGRIFGLTGELELSETYLKKAFNFAPSDPGLLNNLGYTLTNANRCEEALIYLKAAIDHRPDYLIAHWNIALARLKSGDFINGWENHEYRLQLKTYENYHENLKHKPMWKGEDIAHKTLLVVSEQGFGDTLQFCRYLPLLKKYNINIIFKCPLELKSLFSCYENILQLTTEIPTSFDYHIPLMSLPYIFKDTLETIPKKIPYLTTDKTLVENWRKLLSSEKKIKVGLVWSGSFSHELLENYYIARRRNLSFQELSPLANFSNIQFYSLQKGEAAKEHLNNKINFNIIDYTDQFNDFADTAAFVENLDLVITVDTSTAHLAAALGKPTWILSRFDNCWRWLTNREDSPWYPTVRLFTQPKPGDWKSVMEKVAKALTEIMISEKETVL